MDNPKIGLLIYKFKTNTITPREQDLLDAWVIQSDQNKAFFKQSLDSDELLQQYTERRRIIELSSKKDVWQRMLARGIVSKPRTYWLTGWRKYSVAATLLIGLMVVCYIVFNQPQKAEGGKAVTVSSIVPGQAKAILTLSDGRKVYLDSAVANTLSEGNATVQNKNGQLSYISSAGGNKATVYNTLSTTNGQIYSTVLSDGSKIYLNSLSSIRYPVVFTGHERNIEIAGEALFEVAKDKSKPFKVTVNGALLEVTGTTFNVKAYDTSHIQATLLEGGIKVVPSSRGSGQVLKPGQQAEMTRNKVLVKNDVDMEEVIGWKNGLFVFNNVDIKNVLGEVQRWYNVSVRYETDTRGMTFTGQISKYDHVSEVLDMLALMNALKFSLDGRTIVVSESR